MSADWKSGKGQRMKTKEYMKENLHDTSNIWHKLPPMGPQYLESFLLISLRMSSALWVKKKKKKKRRQKII